MTDKTLRFSIILAVTLLSMAISGCVAPSKSVDDNLVHLHVGTLSRSEQIAIRNALESEGFTVRLRDNAIPFDVNTLIYSPFSGSQSYVERIRLAMDAAGYAPDDLILTHAKNHYYTQGHFGLYMQGAEAEGSSQEETLAEVPFNLPDAEFLSNGCESTSIMEFAHEGTVEVALIENDSPETLTWRDKRNIVTLSSGSSTYVYDKKIDSSRDGEEVTFTILLMPTEAYAGLFGCAYLGRTQAVMFDR